LALKSKVFFGGGRLNAMGRGNVWCGRVFMDRQSIVIRILVNPKKEIKNFQGDLSQRR